MFAKCLFPILSATCGAQALSGCEVRFGMVFVSNVVGTAGVLVAMLSTFGGYGVLEYFAVPWEDHIRQEQNQKDLVRQQTVSSTYCLLAGERAVAESGILHVGPPGDCRFCGGIR